MLRLDDIPCVSAEPAAPPRPRYATKRTPEGAENNRTLARERYRRMSPEDRANYNLRCSERRQQRATAEGSR